MSLVPGNLEAGQRLESSFTEGHTYAARIFMGRVVDFNLETYAVAVHLDNTASDVDDIQVACPYFHYSNGEGFYTVPEVGARCAIVYPSDGSEPYVASFLGVIEEVSAKSSDASQQQGGTTSDGMTPDEYLDDDTEADDETDIASGSEPISYRNGRPLPRPGDSFWRTRDGNGIELRRGGLVSIGSTGVCRRLYIPINNLIQDFAQNYKLTTPGISRSFEIFETKNDKTRIQSVLTVREYAEDSNASISIRMGELVDNFYELSIQRAGIDYRKGTVIEESALTLKYSKEGDRELICESDTIQAKERSVIVEEKETEEFGELEQTVNGDRIVKFKDEKKSGTTSKESLQTSKTIDAPSVQLGKGSRAKLVRADLLTLVFNSHIHMVPGIGASGPPAVQIKESLVGCITVEGA